MRSSVDTYILTGRTLVYTCMHVATVCTGIDQLNRPSDDPWMSYFVSLFARAEKGGPSKPIWQRSKCTPQAIHRRIQRFYRCAPLATYTSNVDWTRSTQDNPQPSRAHRAAQAMPEGAECRSAGGQRLEESLHHQIDYMYIRHISALFPARFHRDMT